MKSAVRTVALLEVLAARGDRPARLRELSEELGVPRSSMYALLQTLVEHGWVRTDTTGALYGIGIRALLTGTTYLDSDKRVRLIRPYLDEASDAWVRPSTWHGWTARTSSTWRPGNPTSTCERSAGSAAGSPHTSAPWARPCSPSARTTNSRFLRTRCRPTLRTRSPPGRHCWPTWPRCGNVVTPSTTRKPSPASPASASPCATVPLPPTPSVARCRPPASPTNTNNASSPSCAGFAQRSSLFCRYRPVTSTGVNRIRE